MKKYVLIYVCLFTINAHSSQRSGEQIVISNKNVPTFHIHRDCIDTKSGRKFPNCMNNHHSSSTPNGTHFLGLFSSMHTKNIYTLCFENKTLPSRVQLTHASHGDNIVVSCDDQGVVTIDNKIKNVQFRCINENTPITIGSNLTVYTPISDSKQTLHIKNKNLVQMLVQHIALRNEYQQGCLSSDIWLESQFKSTDNNMIAKSKEFSLQAGEKGTLKTYLSTSPNITKTLTVLRFAQSPQIVLVSFSDGEINSGDTLEVSLHNDNAQIAIAKVTDEGKKILALLYANSVKGLTAVF